jgi:hypothetical protein
VPRPQHPWLSSGCIPRPKVQPLDQVAAPDACITDSGVGHAAELGPGAGAIGPAAPRELQS